MKDKKAILVVEDEPLLEKTFAHLLALWGYYPLTASTGAQALEIARQEPLDLVLMDNHLPDIEAFHLLKQFRKNLFTTNLPVIFLIEKKGFRRELMQKEAVPDDYLIKPVDPLDLRLRVEMVLHRTEHQLQANPLTRLPGGLTIEKEIERRLESHGPLSVCHLDIDHFKSFNDAYGYQQGNNVLHQVSRILVNTVQSFGNETDFVGHIGGDDFIILTTPDREEEICLHAIQEFDRLIPFHYNQEDLKKRHLSVRNRMGKTQRFPLMTLSIAAVNNAKRSLENTLRVSEIASEIKKFLKNRIPSSGSAYLTDRRGGESQGREARKAETAGLPRIPELKNPSKPLGQLLLESRLIQPHQLEEALRKHWRSGNRLGQTLLQMKLVDADTLGRLLSRQLGIPYVKLQDAPFPEELKEDLPEPWLKENGVFPVEKNGSTLSLAMVNPLDRKIIQWVEKKTGCQVKPCLTMEKELDQHLGQLNNTESHGTPTQIPRDQERHRH